MTEKNYSPRQVAQKTGLRYGQVMRRIKKKLLIATKVDWAWVVTDRELKRFAAHEGIELR